MNIWQPISTAPKDGSTIPCCWEGGKNWVPLAWKLNRRIDTNYFGDPNEMDDYDLVENQPTHWFDLPKMPTL